MTDRDWGAPEIHFRNLGYHMVNTSMDFVPVTTNFDKEIDIDGLMKNTSEIFKKNLFLQ